MSETANARSRARRHSRRSRVCRQCPDGRRSASVGHPASLRRSDAKSQAHLVLLRDELAKLGWADGRNLKIEVHWTGGNADRMTSLAREIAASRPNAILTRSTLATAAMLRETRTIPIVFIVVSDPVGDGFVASMARPGGNVTGFTNVEASLFGKWLQLLKEVDPRTTHVAVMYGPKTSAGGGSYYLRLAEEASALTGVKVVAMPVQEAADIDREIDALAKHTARRSYPQRRGQSCRRCIRSAISRQAAA